MPGGPDDVRLTSGARWLAGCTLLWCAASYALSVPGATLLDPLTSTEVATLGGSDQQQYTRLVLGLEVPSPFRYRSFLPGVASLIPDAAIAKVSSRSRLSPGRMAATKLVLLNALFLVLGAAALYRLLRHWQLAREMALLGTLVFLLSFPVIGTAGTPTLDIASWFFITASLVALLERRFLVLAALFAVGIFVKESLQVVIPLAIVAAIPWRDRGWAFVAVLPGLVAYYAMRLGDPLTEPGEALTAALFGYFAPGGGLRPPGGLSVGDYMRSHAEFAAGILRPNRLVDLVLGSFGLLWIPAIRGWVSSDVPPTLRRWALFVPLQLLLILHYGAGLGRVLFATAPVVLAFAMYGFRDWWLASENARTLTEDPAGRAGSGQAD